MMVLKRLYGAAFVAVTIALYSAHCITRARAAEKAVDSKSLADSLIEVNEDEDTWYRSAGLLAFALEIGISE